MPKVVKYPLTFLVVCILGFVIYSILFYDGKKIINEILSTTEEQLVSIDKYFVYGEHLNIQGSLTIDDTSNIKNIKLLFRSNKYDLEYNTEYEINDNKIEFISSKEINGGIKLDDINIDNYFILLKLEFKNSEDTKYYTMKNNTEYTSNEYYTITRNNKNNKILIDFGKNKSTNKNYMSVKVKETKLDNDVYDVVIDPGHGGKDSGAVNGDYYEKDITLDYAKNLKTSLEELGLKVKLTRDGTSEEDLGIYTIYGENGRAVIPNKVKAKYTFSIHLNSAPYNLSTGGVEVYAPSLCNLDFATLIANNIVENANTTYSLNEEAKVKNGVYVRTLSNEDIAVARAEAISNGYEPYDIKPNTPYYFMIRETGGIATNAYADGRNKLYDKNIYYDSNSGSETYLVELGFMVSKKDLNNILENKNKYISGLTNAIKIYLDL